MVVDDIGATEEEHGGPDAADEGGFENVQRRDREGGFGPAGDSGLALLDKDGPPNVSSL